VSPVIRASLRHSVPERHGTIKSELDGTEVEKAANRDKKAISRPLNANAMNLFELLIRWRSPPCALSSSRARARADEN